MHLCLILDLDLFDASDPEPVALLGQLRRMAAQLEALRTGARLELVLAGPDRAGFDQVSQVTGDAGQPLVADRSVAASALCAQGARAIEVTRRDVPRNGAQLWQPGNVMTGVEALDQVAQRAAEAAGLPQPRPMDPARRIGSIFALPREGGRDLMWRAAYEIDGADWVRVNQDSFVFAPYNSGQWLVQEGARLVLKDVARGDITFDKAFDAALPARVPGAGVQPDGWLSLRRR